MPDLMPAPDRARLYAPFRPRAARVVSLVLAVAVAVGTAALLIALRDFFNPFDMVGVGLFGGGIAWFCWREASVRADVDEQGIVVRNLMLTRRLAWAQVVSVRFGSGRPWVQLDLADGDVLAVMGVQQADGAHARAEAGRLAALVAIHTRTPRDD
ncbi:PH domain-containing protein [Cellulomonas aerilata]|uniref:Low molecular weight protein antigen 6 PH domain-containing protein n=1 Tax=Cellulomonas aerilata TaxID=515326 RepID=A0A512DAD3_9CELL|nr:PH domain-containing protein [Cellulomonas aerilata]GEO33441.1 hypothetical protein CAE01nite_11660 [Cellulomonas aerilata]